MRLMCQLYRGENPAKVPADLNFCLRLPKGCRLLLWLDWATATKMLLDLITCLPDEDGGIPLMPSPRSQLMNLPVFSPHCSLRAKRQEVKL